MSRKSVFNLCIAGICLFFMGHRAFSQGTAFMYQGQLGSSGNPANGSYNFKFTLYTAETNGTPASGSLTNYNVAVNNGLFTTTLDFGPNIFTGSSLWLQIGVCTNSTTNFTILQPLQPVLPTPYAIFANSASNLVGVLAASQLSGTLPATAFTGYTNTVALTNGANLFAGSFSGNGAGVTNVSVTNLVGVLADSQVPTNTAFVNSNQTFTANNTFNGSNTFTNLYGNSFSGSFFGNGLVGWIVVPGTTINASIDTGYLLTNSQMVTVSLPATAHVGDVVRIAYAGSSGWQLAQAAGQSIIGNFLGYGQTWYQSGAAAEDWTCIASSSDGTKMVATSSAVSAGNVWVSGNSGQSWSGTSASGDASVWQAVASSADGTKLYAAAGNGGSLYFSTNSGTAWSPVPSSGASWSSIACSSDGTRLVGGTSTKMLYTTLGGTFITGSPTTAPVTSVASASGGNYLVAATFGGDLYVSSNYGTNWTPEEGSAGWAAVACSGDGSKMAAAISNGTIYVSSNFGSTWSATAAPAEAWVSIASSSDGSKLVAAAAKGGLFTSSNWGATWTLHTNNYASASANWSCVTSSSSGSILAAGINNTLTSSTYGIFTSDAATQTQTTSGTGGYISGSQGSAAELQCIGNNEWMPVSSSGTLWAQ